MATSVRLLLTGLGALLLTCALSAQSFEVGVFGEGLFTTHHTGGVGGRVGFTVAPGLGLEAEAAREFHSETFTISPGQKYYDSGYNFLAGARFRVPLPLIHLFATAKGGLLHSTTHPEDETQPSLPSVTSGAAYLGGGIEIGGTVALRIDGGDLLLFESGLKRNNPRVTAGISFFF